MANKVNIDFSSLGINWQAGKTYSLELDTGFVIEESGNRSPNSATSISSWVSDYPDISQVVPAHNATNYADATVSMTYDSGRVTLKSGKNISIYKNGVLLTTLASTNSRITTSTNNTVTLDLLDILDKNNTYHIQIDNGFIEDGFNLASYAVTDDSKIKFTTSDGPVVTPAIDTQLGYVNDLPVTYNRPISLYNTGKFKLYQSNGTFVNTLTNVSKINTTTVSINLLDQVTGSQNYYITQEDGVVRDDISHYTNSAVTDDSKIKFVTSPGPEISTVTPVIDTQLEYTTTFIKVAYNRPIELFNSGKFKLYESNGNFVNSLTNVTKLNTTTVSVNLYGAINGSRNYYITQESGVVRDDVTHYTNIPVADNSKIRFTTKPGPSITSVQNLAPQTKQFLNYNLPVSINTDSGKTFKIYRAYDNYLQAELPATSTRVTSSSTTQIMLNLAHIIQGDTSYYVTADEGVTRHTVSGYGSTQVANTSTIRFTTPAGVYLSDAALVGDFTTQIRLLANQTINPAIKSNRQFHLYENGQLKQSFIPTTVSTSSTATSYIWRSGDGTQSAVYFNLKGILDGENQYYFNWDDAAVIGVNFEIDGDTNYVPFNKVTTGAKPAISVTDKRYTVAKFTGENTYRPGIKLTFSEPVNNYDPGPTPLVVRYTKDNITYNSQNISINDPLNIVSGNTITIPLIYDTAATYQVGDNLNIITDSNANQGWFSDKTTAYTSKVINTNTNVTNPMVSSWSAISSTQTQYLGVINYDRDIFKNAGLSRIYDSNNTLLQEFSLTNVTVSGPTLSIPAIDNIYSSSTYYITYDSGFIKDGINNPNDTTSLSFTTKNTPYFIRGTSVNDAKIKVASLREGDFVKQPNKNLYIYQGNTLIKTASSDELEVENNVLVDETVSNSLAITTGDLTRNTVYNVRIDDGIVKNGYMYNRGISTSSLTFTTDSGPISAKNTSTVNYQVLQDVLIPSVYWQLTSTNTVSYDDYIVDFAFDRNVQIINTSTLKVVDSSDSSLVTTSNVVITNNQVFTKVDSPKSQKTYYIQYEDNTFKDAKGCVALPYTGTNITRKTNIIVEKRIAQPGQQSVWRPGGYPYVSVSSDLAYFASSYLDLSQVNTPIIGAGSDVFNTSAKIIGEADKTDRSTGNWGKWAIELPPDYMTSNYYFTVHYTNSAGIATHDKVYYETSLEKTDGAISLPIVNVREPYLAISMSNANSQISKVAVWTGAYDLTPDMILQETSLPSNSYYGKSIGIDHNYIFVSAVGANKVFVYNIADGSLRYSITRSTDSGFGKKISINQNDTEFIIASDYKIFVYNKSTGTLIRTIDVLIYPEIIITAYLMDKYIAVSYDTPYQTRFDRYCKFYNRSTGNLVYTVQQKSNTGKMHAVGSYVMFSDYDYSSSWNPGYIEVLKLT